MKDKGGRTAIVATDLTGAAETGYQSQLQSLTPTHYSLAVGHFVRSRPLAAIFAMRFAPYFLRPMAAATAPGLRIPPRAAMDLSACRCRPWPRGSPAGAPRGGPGFGGEEGRGAGVAPAGRVAELATQALEARLGLEQVLAVAELEVLLHRTELAGNAVRAVERLLAGDGKLSRHDGFSLDLQYGVNSTVESSEIVSKSHADIGW